MLNEQDDINFLIQQLRTSNDKLVVKKAAERLGETGACNENLVETLIYFVRRCSLIQPAYFRILFLNREVLNFHGLFILFYLSFYAD